mmetsp:Transcript_33168/g.73977  ORF Transcript_33168/g.73977 Transcript_33168/m.73977 type:complete len:142 (+) Transcript_33168:33-458(+)
MSATMRSFAARVAVFLFFMSVEATVASADARGSVLGLQRGFVLHSQQHGAWESAGAGDPSASRHTALASLLEVSQTATRPSPALGQPLLGFQRGISLSRLPPSEDLIGQQKNSRQTNLQDSLLGLQRGFVLRKAVLSEPSA